MLTNSEVIAEAQRHKRGPMIKISLCRNCYTVYFDRKDISVAQFGYMRDSLYEATSHTQKNSDTMFVHTVVEAYCNLQQ